MRQHRAAAIGRRRDHETGPQDGVGSAGSHDQTFGLTLRRCERGSILAGGPGNRDVHKPDRTAAAANRLKQSYDEIAMHRVGIAAGAVLEHAEAVHDDIDRVLTKEARQSRRIEGEDRQLDVQRAHLLRHRQAARHPDHAKSMRAKIVGDVAADQAGGAEHENGSLAHDLPQNGFAIISQRISIVAPKPGKPNANQRRNRTK
ncbi:hypothetical protein ACVWXL_007367 [Bradyrhizobium sp. GM22.5]